MNNKVGRFLGRGVSLLCALALVMTLPIAGLTVSAANETVHDGSNTYTVNTVYRSLLENGSYSMYIDGTEVDGDCTAGTGTLAGHSGFTMTMTGANGAWVNEAYSIAVQGQYLYYNFTVSEGGGLSIEMDYVSGNYGVKLSETLAAKHGKTTTSGNDSYGATHTYLPAGTYEGLLSVSTFFSKTSFDWAVFSLTEGTTVNFNAFAFVDATLSEGETPTTTTTTKTPVVDPDPDTPITGTTDGSLYWHNDAQYQISGTALSLLSASGTGEGITSEAIDGTLDGISGYALENEGEEEATYAMPSVSVTGAGAYLLFDFTLYDLSSSSKAKTVPSTAEKNPPTEPEEDAEYYMAMRVNTMDVIPLVAKEYGYIYTAQGRVDQDTGLPAGRYTGLIDKSALGISGESAVTLELTLAPNTGVDLNGIMFVDASTVPSPLESITEAHIVGGKVYTIDTLYQWLLRSDGTITEDGSAYREAIYGTLVNCDGARFNGVSGGHVIYNSANGGGWTYTFNANHYLYYDFEVTGDPMTLMWSNDGGGYSTAVSLNSYIAAQNDATLNADGTLPAGSYGGMLKLSDIGATTFAWIGFNMGTGTTVDCYALAIVDATAVTTTGRVKDGTPMTATFEVKGAGIRFDRSETNGSDIRFATEFGKKTLYSTFYGSNTYAYGGVEAFEYGALLIPTEVLKTKCGHQYQGTPKQYLYTDSVENIETHVIYDQDSSTLLYTSVLLDIPNANRDSKISVRGYLRFKIGDEYFVIYTRVLERSVLDTAKEALKDNPDDEELKDLIEEIEGGQTDPSESTTTTTTTTTTTVPSGVPTKPTEDETTTTTTKPVDPEDPKIDFNEEEDNIGISSWWWSGGTNGSYTESDATYLAFLQKNQVHELYWYPPVANRNNYTALADFLDTAYSYGVDEVSWLIDGQDWTYVTSFLNYQTWAAQNNRRSFYAIHIDWEPWVGTWDPDGLSNILKNTYAPKVKEVTKQVRAAGQKTEWDIAAWFDDRDFLLATTVSYTDASGTTTDLPIIDYLMTTADTLVLMSYRDYAYASDRPEGVDVDDDDLRDGILDISYGEIERAKIHTNCKVVLGVETQDASIAGGDYLTFHEEGQATMYEQMHLVYNYLKAQLGNEDDESTDRNLKYGMAIHDVANWYNINE